MSGEPTSPGNGSISAKTTVKLPLFMFLSLLGAVAGAAYGFQAAIATGVKVQLAPYVTRLEWVQRLDAEDRKRDHQFFALRAEVLRLERRLIK